MTNGGRPEAPPGDARMVVVGCGGGDVVMVVSKQQQKDS